MAEEKLIFEGPNNPDRGYTCRAWDVGSGDARIEILKDGNIVRSFGFPAYKVWNVPAHFRDIVDSEIAGDTAGYEAAAWTGFPMHIVSSEEEA